MKVERRGSKEAKMSIEKWAASVEQLRNCAAEVKDGRIDPSTAKVRATDLKTRADQEAKAELDKRSAKASTPQATVEVSTWFGEVSSQIIGAYYEAIGEIQKSEAKTAASAAAATSTVPSEAEPDAGEPPTVEYNDGLAALFKEAAAKPKEGKL
jgi:hypothetical protein